MVRGSSSACHTTVPTGFSVISSLPPASSSTALVAGHLEHVIGPAEVGCRHGRSVPATRARHGGARAELMAD